MIRLELVDSRDAARIVDALLTAVEVEATKRPMLARRYLMLADRLGDAIQLQPLPQHAPSLDPLHPDHQTRNTE
jgi:hypothetical protein